MQLSRSLALLTAGLALAGLVLSQETEKPHEAETKPEIELPSLGPEDADAQEMIRLFHEVERTLESIDVELFDAGAGRLPAPEGRESGLERLLQSSGSKSSDAVSGIERILELAEKMGGKSGSCMKDSLNPPPGQGQKSPLEQEEQRGPSQGEKTPEAPKPGGEKPEQPDPKGSPQDPKPQDGPGKNPPSGENRPSPPRVDESGNPVGLSDDADRWGTLPERVQQVFRNQITDDLPLQYRDWIDSYYRRLNKVR